MILSNLCGDNPLSDCTVNYQGIPETSLLRNTIVTELLIWQEKQKDTIKLH